MRRTGYTDDRAREHEAEVDAIVAYGQRKGLPVRKLPVDGHYPDIDWCGRLVDVKVSPSPNVAIDEDDFKAWQELANRGTAVDVWHKHPDGWYRDTIDGIMSRASECRPPTGNGSNDHWRLVHSGGTPMVWP